MKVKFIKGRRAGQVVDVPDKRAFYWKLIGLAVDVFEVVKEAVKEKKPKKSNPVTPKKTARKKKGD